ncbi:hypothetical protein [Bacillus sp. EB600]|uniref:hypothetical protein n=1 Tax=Bacillus sp. EB600 TaxID=2806345 RepID=UPI00210B112D|nr:hypothetical protein [Bacillus sp. EB600]MCQ6282560.1 hypothetical protein [Bacillus sp. EB600]
MNKKIGIQNLFLGKPVQLSQPNQMVKPRQPFHQNQFWGRPIKKPLTNQNSKIQRLKALQKSNNSRNQPKRERFYTPQELLKLAPIHDKAMWQLIISRLPTDYRLPDPEFVKIYKNFFKSK